MVLNVKYLLLFRYSYRCGGALDFYNNRTFLLAIPQARHHCGVDQDSNNTPQGPFPRPCRQLEPQ